MIFFVEAGLQGRWSVNTQHVTAVFVDLLKRRLKIQSNIRIGRNKRDADLGSRLRIWRGMILVLRPAWLNRLTVIR